MTIAFPDHYGDFLRVLGDKLTKGQEVYGSGSFERSEDELLGELQSEAVDLAGWGYVLWARIEEIRRRQECKCRIAKRYKYVWDDKSPTGKTMVETADDHSHCWCQERTPEGKR